MIRTERVLLRPWRDEDRDPLASMSADPRVMEFFPSVLTREESDALMDRCQTHIDEHGFGFWAVEIPGVTPFVGILGIAISVIDAPFTPCVEIGWRLAAEYWGRGYVTEAAQATLSYGFESLRLDEIVACTVPHNFRSRAVMERIGMSHDPTGDFNHPRVPDGHPLQLHTLYRISATT